MKRSTLIAFAWLVLVANIGVNAQSEPTKIFRCKAQGRVTFADRPCGGESTEVALGPINSFNSDSTSGRNPPSPANTSGAIKSSDSSSDGGSIAAEQLRQQQQEQHRCQQLSNQLDALQAKLRSGYTAKQHNSLQQRRRLLEEQLRQSRCR